MHRMRSQTQWLRDVWRVVVCGAWSYVVRGRVARGRVVRGCVARGQCVYVARG